MPQTSKAAPSKRTAGAKKAPAKKVVVAPAVEPVAPPAVAAPAPAAPRRSWLTPFAIVMIIAVILGIVLVGALGSEERGGPPHTFANLSNGTPATLYVPGKMDGDN